MHTAIYAYLSEAVLAGTWKGWKVYFNQAVPSDCRYTKDGGPSNWTPSCCSWRFFWGVSDWKKPNENACARYYDDKKRFGTCGLKLAGPPHNNVWFKKTSCKLKNTSDRPCLGTISPIVHFTTCKKGWNKNKSGCDAGIVIRNNRRFLALTVRYPHRTHQHDIVDV